MLASVRDATPLLERIVGPYADDATFAFVEADESPSAAAFHGDSVIYVFRNSSTGHFYVGETEDFGTRVSQHRKVHSGALEFAYVRVQGGRGAARRMEQRAIRALLAAGVPLERDRDGNFGASGACG